tara:strand:- start:158 stop:667 length:510 start_codon:yes stop_codon:yes gene_type:complete
MAQTQLHKYSVQEKLNKMDVDLIDVQPTVDTSAYAAGDLMFNPIEISNAVAVDGGTAILQSISVANDDALVGSFDIILTSNNDAPGTLNNAVSGESGLSDANADSILGIVTISNMVDVGGCSIGSKANIGLVLKAAAGTKSIYAWGIAQSTDNPTTDTGYKLRIGVVKD